MMKISLLLFSLLLILSARENPFFPLESDLDIPLTTNQTQKAPPLTRATIQLPSTARTLQSIMVEYKNFDGTVGKKSIELDNSIDWHLPLFISQNYKINEKRTCIQNRQSKNNPKKYKKVLSLKFIQFYTRAKEIKIVTHDTLLRNFFLVKPHRIVCDFQRNTDIGTVVKDISNQEGYKKINIGTHKGYYRVVIELDGYYHYRLKKIPQGYKLTLM